MRELEGLEIEDNAAADDSAVRRIQAECSGQHALQTRTFKFNNSVCEAESYRFCNCHGTCLVFVVDTYQYSNAGIHDEAEIYQP
jgi:hypothetical protein